MSTKGLMTIKQKKKSENPILLFPGFISLKQSFLVFIYLFNMVFVFYLCRFVSYLLVYSL